MSRRLLAFALAFAASAAVAAAPRYIIDRWNIEDGLPNNALSHVIQSRDGYLWIATWAGTVRFDGVRFTPIAEDLPNDHARVLFEDRDGAMWIGVSGAGLVRWRGGRFEILTVADGLAGHDVRALAQDPEGRIWAGTENGLSVIDLAARESTQPETTLASAAITTLRIDEGLSANTIHSLSRGSDGGIWIATAGGICVAQGLQPICHQRRFFSGRPNAVLQDADRRVWVGTNVGLFSEGLDLSSLAGHPVSVLLSASQGGVWVGFADGGVALVDAAGVERYGPGDGLPSGPVVGLHEDAEGSLWIATYNGGLARLKPRRVTMYSTAEGLPARVVGSIVQDAGGTIWAGTQCGPVSELRDGRFVPRFTEYTKDACAWVMWPARDGSLWIGTRGSGLFRWTGGRMEHFGLHNGLSDMRVAALFEDRAGVMWIGTEFGGVHTFANGTLSRAFGTADGVATGYIASFAQDRDGRVWIGSNANGLSVYEGGKFRILSPAESPPTRNIAGLLVDSRGDLWIGSAADGLFRLRHGRYEPFGVAQGLGDRLIAVVVEDRDANLWVCTARGISRLERAKIEAVAEGRAASLEPIVLDRADGLLSAEGSGGGLDPSGLRDSDGRVWISTIDGIAVIDPASFRVNAIAPTVLIEGVTLADRAAALSTDGIIEVPAGTESIELAYTAFSLWSPSRVRFRYHLDGYETQWHDAGARRTAYFTRLPPGEYRFEVMAANNDGVWSTSPATLSLVVLPFWWQRLDVQVAALGLLLATTGFVVRSVSLARTRTRLATLERAHALERERTRIARDLHDDLGSRLSLIGLITEGTQASTVARDAAETLDQLVWTVNAQNDTAGSFAAYAGRFAEEHLDAAGLSHRFHIEHDLGRYELGAETRRQVYLAFKEAINNVVKHARATEVHISIGVGADGRTLVVEVADNGCGFAAGRGDPTGIGLGGMRERLAAVGGSVDITSPPQCGTRVVFRSPLLPGRDGASHSHAIPHDPRSGRD